MADINSDNTAKSRYYVKLLREAIEILPKRTTTNKEKNMDVVKDIVSIIENSDSKN